MEDKAKIRMMKRYAWHLVAFCRRKGLSRVCAEIVPEHDRIIIDPMSDSQAQSLISCFEESGEYKVIPHPFVPRHVQIISKDPAFDFISVLVA